MYVENILSISFSCSEKVNKYDSMESCESLKSDQKVALNKLLNIFYLFIWNANEHLIYHITE